MMNMLAESKARTKMCYKQPRSSHRIYKSANQLEKLIMILHFSQNHGGRFQQETRGQKL